MKSWHYNIVRILKGTEFKRKLIECLDVLEGYKEHSIIIAMLLNYFSLRNVGFKKNSINFPLSRVTLNINRRGVYFSPCKKTLPCVRAKINKLNTCLFEAIGLRDWVITFSKPTPPTY